MVKDDAGGVCSEKMTYGDGGVCTLISNYPDSADADNHLQCAAGKFAEPSVWLNYIRRFFGKRGYRVIGDPEIEGEYMDSFGEVCKEKERQYKLWKDKKKALNSVVESALSGFLLNAR